MTKNINNNFYINLIFVKFLHSGLQLVYDFHHSRTLKNFSSHPRHSYLSGEWNNSSMLREFLGQTGAGVRLSSLEDIQFDVRIRELMTLCITLGIIEDKGGLEYRLLDLKCHSNSSTRQMLNQSRNNCYTTQNSQSEPKLQ